MPPSSAFARHFAAHFVDLEVDIETGEIKLLDWLATQDSGTIMNPQVMKNQMIGGAICGAGFAIYESLVFDKETGRIKNANLLDYKLLRAADFPVNGEVIYGDSYDSVGPFGARGAGEHDLLCLGGDHAAGTGDGTVLRGAAVHHPAVDPVPRREGRAAADRRGARGVPWRAGDAAAVEG